MNSSFSELESVGYEMEVGMSPFQILPTLAISETMEVELLITKSAALAAGSTLIKSDQMAIADINIRFMVKL